MLAKAGKYDNCLFHRLVPGFMVQTGDPTGTGAGGESYWGTPFRDEYNLKGAAKHDSRGVLAMANKGAGTNGSQFYITFKSTPHLDNKHTVFGKLVGGEDVLDAIEKLPVKEGTERPSKPVTITHVVIHQDPFDDYKARLAKKLARRTESGADEAKPVVKKPGDDSNWFGVRVGTGQSVVSNGDTEKSVGRYLGVKRQLEEWQPPEDVASEMFDGGKKKRRTGFGNFDNW